MEDLTTWVAAVAAGAAIALLLPTDALRRSAGRFDRPWTRPPSLLVVGAGAAAVSALVVEGRMLVLALVGVTAAGGWLTLARRRRARKEAGRRTDRVVELCEALSAELRAGQPPAVGLSHACEFWDELAPVVVAAELGADVPTALRRVGDLPGAQGLREVAGAWQVAATSGATLAMAVARVADVARRRQATGRLVATELAAAQATASMLALLPVGILAMGSGVGGDPVAFLVGTTAGLVCLGLGVLFGLAGLLWIEHIAEGAASW